MSKYAQPSSVLSLLLGEHITLAFAEFIRYLTLSRVMLETALWVATESWEGKENDSILSPPEHRHLQPSVYSSTFRRLSPIIAWGR